jgi:glycosyltransferase involved in cell wall biosynthesis
VTNLNSCEPLSGGKENMPLSPNLGQRNLFHVAVVVEDLRAPFDEGAKKVGFSLIRSLPKKGVKVSVFTRYENPLLKSVFRLPFNKFLIGYQFCQHLKAREPDVILYIPTSSGTLGAFIRAAIIKIQSSGTPLVLMNLQYRELPGFTRHISLDRFADVVLTYSQASAAVFRSFGCKTILLPGGVDHTVFRPVSRTEKHLLRAKYGFQALDKIVLHVGHCKRDRNVGFLSKLVESGLRPILIVSTSTAVDHDLLDELRLSGVTVVTDFMENVQHFYQMSDCYLFPVFHTTSAIDAPLSVLEAMACNLPVVTTRFGALPDMFQSGNGFYYGYNEEDILRLVRQAVGEPNCRTFEKVSPYSWDNAASIIIETLRETANL